MKEYHARYSEAKLFFPFGAECWKNAGKRNREIRSIFQAIRIEHRKLLRENEAVCVTLITEAWRFAWRTIKFYRPLDADGTTWFSVLRIPAID